ncbi:MAG: hypothetical protein JSW60_04160 [Thermoplasmatales archaeon]|nr:MAG: hypothetical protein JSW60_04160 [Thermoplasmatales archaeon]
MKENINTNIDDDVKDDLIDAFELVKKLVRKSEGRSRAGLMLGLQELGASLNGFIGAYYPVSSNIIVMNKTPIRRINETYPKLIKPYSTHILLHEYIHSLGIIDETITRQKTYEISREHFGEEHLVTKFSRNMEQFFPFLVYPFYGWFPQSEVPIELIKGFDKSSINNYIA